MRAPETLVTVVMPVFNGLEWLEETIGSVAAQRGVRLERIAVDDGSIDGTGHFLQQHGWTVLRTDNVGPNVARARAIEVATGDLVAFLDQDDLWHPDHLALAVATLSSFPRASAAVAPRVSFYGRSRPRLGASRRGPATFDPWAVYPINIIDTPSMAVVRRPALEAAGGWPADRSLGSDPLLWWRLSVGAPLAIASRRTVGVRRSERSLSVISRDRPLDYLRHLRIAASDALADLPVDRAQVLAASGKHLFAAIAAVIAAVIDGERLAVAAQDLEAALGNSSDAMVTATVGFWGWLVAPQLRLPAATVNDTVTAIIDTWPASARRTRSATLRMVAAVAGPWRASDAAMRGPSPGRLAVAGAAWAFAAAARCGRVADPLGLALDHRSSFLLSEPAR